MKKMELIHEVTKVLKSKKEAHAAVNSMLENILLALKDHEDVTLTGFGTFKTVKTKARTGRNPRTGETMEIRASTRIKFSPGKALKESMN
jgi:DNA-binding protein HU-beta